MKLLQWVMEQGYEEKVASSLIKQGKVTVNSVKETLLNYQIKKEDTLIILGKESEYVSRGAYKLIEAIKQFNLNFNNLITLDIGSSTGGFTQVALKNGAQKVYSVDVGTNQLDFSLRRNPQVVSMEKTNVKTLTRSSFEDVIDIIVCDVSFISLRRVFDVIKDILDAGKDFIGLIKPQFEANSSEVQSGGFVPEELHKRIIDDIANYAKDSGFKMINIVKSPIKGKTSKNQEYLTLFRKV